MPEKRTADALELQLQATVSLSVWLLGTKLRSSSKQWVFLMTEPLNLSLKYRSQRTDLIIFTYYFLFVGHTLIYSTDAW